MEKTALPKPGDEFTTVFRVKGLGYWFKHDGFKFHAHPGEWVTVTRRWFKDERYRELDWYDVDMRPATADEVEHALGPVRWWQWRRRRRLRPVRAVLLRARGS